MYALYQISDGALISESAEIIVNSDPSRGVKETPKPKYGRWNASTLVFDAPELHRVVSLSNFIDRFTDLERDDLFEAAKTIKKANTFIQVMKLIGSADLDSDFIITHVNLMETASVLGPGRAAEILNG